MLLSQHACQIVSVGDVKDSKGFKKFFVVVKTKEMRDETTGEVTRPAGEFECEATNVDRMKELTDVKGQDVYLPCTFILRSFRYKEKDIDKLGKQLQLKRWWR